VIYLDVSENKIYKVNKSRVLRKDSSLHSLLGSLEKLIRFTDISSLLKTINKEEQIKSLSKVVRVYFVFLDPFLYFPSIISLILNHLMTKNIKDEEEEFISEIEKKLLFSWEEVVNSLIKKRFVNGFWIIYNDIRADFSLTFLLCGGLWIVTNIFYKFKHFYNFQHFSFRKYELLEINTVITNFIRDLLKEGKLITFLKTCDTVFKSYKQNMNELRIFEPLIFYLFILKRMLNPSFYYEDDELSSFLSKYPSNFWTNWGLSTYCETKLGKLKNRLIIILKYLFFQGKRNTSIKTE
jgi:hypothetical protein